MAEQVVLFEIHNNIGWVTLNRPTAMNSLTPGILAGIDAALDEVTKHSEVRAVVFTGAGRAFSAGADLKFIRESSGGNPRALQDFLQSVYTVLNRVEHFPRPTIAAVNGLALAGGFCNWRFKYFLGIRRENRSFTYSQLRVLRLTATAAASVSA